jgi:hypothetical protein
VAVCVGCPRTSVGVVDGVGVRVAVAVGVRDGEDVGVPVGEDARVGVLLFVDVGVGVLVDVRVAVLVLVAVAVDVLVGVGKDPPFAVRSRRTANPDTQGAVWLAIRSSILKLTPSFGRQPSLTSDVSGSSPGMSRLKYQDSPLETSVVVCR